MAVTKLKLLSISGELKKLSAVLSMFVKNPYLHIEDAATVLNDIHGIVTVIEDNPYKELLNTTEEIASLANIDLANKFNTDNGNNDADDILEINIDEVKYLIKTQSEKLKARLTLIQDENNFVIENKKILEQLKHIKNTEINFNSVFHFEFFKFRFGHMPREVYDSISLYAGDLDDFFFIPSSIEQKDVWGMYFAPRTKSVRIDSLFKMLHFERVRISDKAHGTPEEAHRELSSEIENINARIASLNAELQSIIDETATLIDKYYKKILLMATIFELRKKAVRTMTSFHIITWVPENQVDKITEQFTELSLIVAPINASPDVLNPPTLIRNFPLFRPFEQFVEMYGLPSYNEIDPTPFIAFTYILFFGIMFADLGQGFVLLLLGFFLWVRKKINLGRIIGIVGISSMIFGAVFGSVFGFEDIIHGYNPMEHIDFVLLIAIAFGAVTISIAIILNIINGVYQKNYEKIFLSPNGLAGLTFYWSVFIIILMAMNFITVDAIKFLLPVFIAITCICLLAMYLKEPLLNILNKRKKLIHESPVEFIIVNFFEMFEIILSFLTNTISFIRIGAFALNHVGMMTVVLLLSQNINGSTNPVALIIGNIVVIGLEGLIVGIQCLRLEYYEILGRFFEGDGRRFESNTLSAQKNKNNL